MIGPSVLYEHINFIGVLFNTHYGYGADGNYIYIPYYSLDKILFKL